MFSAKITPEWLLWAPAVLSIAHVLKEFVVPGGFMAWYRRYRGPAAQSVTAGFLWRINALLLAGSLDAGYLGHRESNLWFWLAIAGVLGSNGLWHAWASWKSRSYSPGLVTGMLLYLPLSSYATYHSWAASAMTPKAWGGLLLGGLYPLWSALMHRIPRN